MSDSLETAKGKGAVDKPIAKQIRKAAYKNIKFLSKLNESETTVLDYAWDSGHQAIPAVSYKVLSEKC